MFKKLKIVSILSLILSMVSSAFAGNIVLSPGARANNYGGAFTAIADDGTAIYWNPAGLAYQEGQKVTASVYYINKDAKASSSLPIGSTTKDAFQKYAGTDPDAFVNKNYQTKATLPFVSYSKELDSEMVLAVGAYVLGGGGGIWEDKVANTLGTGTMYGKIDGEMALMVFNISGAKKVCDELSFGAGLNLVYLDEKVKVEQSQTGATPYSTVLETKDSGYNFEATLGSIYKPMDELSLGLIIRSGAYIETQGDLKISGNVANYTTGYNDSFQLPLTVSLGSAYDLTEQVKLSAQVDYYNYSSMKTERTYYQPNDSLFITNGRFYDKWNDMFVFSIGGEYKCTDALSLFAGYQYEPSPYNKDSINLLETNQYTYDIYSIGTEYKFLDAYVFNLNIMYSKARDLKDNSGVSYEYDPLVYRATLTYNF